MEDGSRRLEPVEVIVDMSIERNEISGNLAGLVGKSATVLEMEDSPVRFESLKYVERDDAEDNRIFLGREAVADFFVKPVAKTKSRGKTIFGVPTSEWPTILRLDKEVYEVGRKLNFSKIFRPLNQIGELDRFVSERGRYDPAFVYDFPDLKYTDGLRIRLDELAKRSDPRDFQTPAIALYHEKLDELRTKCDLVDAYRNGDYAAVAPLDDRLYGPIDPDSVEEAVGKIFRHDAGASKEELLGPILDKHRIETLLRENLQRIGMEGVAIEWGDSGLSRVAVSYGRVPKIRLSEHAPIRERELLSIFAHEVETHLLRGIRGEESGLLLLKHGSGFYLPDEEGLAIWNSFRALPEGYRKNAMYEQYFLVSQAGSRSFSELADMVRSFDSGRTLAHVFNLCLRLKRGVERTAVREEGAFFGKNKVYLNGYRRVSRWIESGGDPQALFVGKIKISDLEFVS